ncbi:MAG TPA: hypothetical protein VKU84_07515 [Stellaceae bacterium]|nr:hypothetical protein [Stellaceae bacterium]
MSVQAAATPRPASTVLLLRDNAASEIEVFMMVRHHEIEFSSGALVFPGGKLEDADGDPRLRARCGGADKIGDGELKFRIAGVREAFEECGILLARKAAGGPMLTTTALAELLARHPDAGDFAAWIDRARLMLATDLLVPFAHWITPADQPKRFDTHFFLAPAPDQVARHDGHEATIVHWLTAEAAIAAARRGEIKLVLPTRLNLLKLGRSGTVAEALDAARRSEIVPVQPEIVETAGGPAFRIPAAADYGVTEVLVSSYRRA